MLLKEYFNHLRKREYSQSMIKHTRYAVRRYALYLKQQRKEILQGNQEDFEGFILDLKRTLAPHTVSCICQMVRHFFKFLRIEGYIILDPTDGFGPLPKVERLPRTIPSQEAVVKMIDHVDKHSIDGPRDKAVLEVLYSTLGNGQRRLRFILV